MKQKRHMEYNWIKLYKS